MRFELNAINSPDGVSVNCSGNPGGVIFAVTSNDCASTASCIYNSATCLCEACSTLLLGCLQCTSKTVCTVCDSAAGYDLNSTSKACQTCSSLGSCSPICRDGFVVSPETCDDSNTASGDGCSSQCTIEASYQCSVDPGNTVSTCWLAGPFQLTYLDIKKLLGSNSANLTFSVSPADPALSSQNWSSILTSSSFSIDSANYADGILSLIVSYKASLDGQTLSLTTVNQSARYARLTPASVDFSAITTGGLPAVYFTPEEQ